MRQRPRAELVFKELLFRSSTRTYGSSMPPPTSVGLKNVFGECASTSHFQQKSIRSSRVQSQVRAGKVVKTSIVRGISENPSSTCRAARRRTKNISLIVAEHYIDLSFKAAKFLGIPAGLSNNVELQPHFPRRNALECKAMLAAFGERNLVELDVIAGIAEYTGIANPAGGHGTLTGDKTRRTSKRLVQEQLLRI
jgi:hypothetical protein